MTDREMLELAAKAAGISGEWARWHQAYGDEWVEGLNCGGRFLWNPLVDDGDGARMEAAIGIHVTWHSDGVVCGKRIWQETAMFEDHNGDKQAARRIASLRIAAEVGKATP